MVDPITSLAKIEALLFAHGEPLSEAVIAEAIGLNIEELRRIMADWSLRLQQDSESGLCLICQNNAYQLVTKPACRVLLENFLKKDFSQELSPAALETLTITLYRGPLSRSEIDYIRGVNSSFMVRSLLLRGLIERLPDPKHRRFFAYQPSFALLRFLGLQTVAELPDYQTLHQKYEEILSQASLEEQTILETDASD